jgi:PAS domain S-box-containing protein
MGFGMEERPINLFIGDSLKARLMRNFFPASIFIIIIAGWIDTYLFHFYYEPIIVSSIITIFSLFALGYLIFNFSGKIGNDIDAIFEYRKKAEEKLRESELHFRTLADSGQALIWTSGIDRKCDYFNKTWLEFTGRTIDQELGDGWVEGIHPDELEFCFETYSTAFAKRESFSMDYRLRFNDGTYRWIQDKGTPRYNTRNEFVGFIGHCLDINDAKLAEKLLKESENRYRLITNSLTDYIFSTKVLPNGKTEMEWVVGAIESISGYTIEEYSARGGWRSIIHPDDYQLDENAFTRLLKNENVEFELRNIHKNGETVWVQIFAHPVWDNKKNCLTQVFGAVKDITRQLESAPAPVDCVAPVADALHDRLEIICDGGIRRGNHIVKALASGANACSIGRACLYGLAAGGQAGVDRSLTILRDEFERTLALLGCNDVAGLQRTSVRRRGPW